MPGQQRKLPARASLRYLKLEAKRRLAAGEFPALHQAQLAIANEHGLQSWAALKGAIDAQDPLEGPAVRQLRWIAARFRDVGAPGWAPPGEGELREHFTAGFLASIPPGRLVATITELAPEMRNELVITSQTRFAASGRLAGHLVMAVTESAPPHRLTGVRMRPLGSRISDPRVASPSAATAGEVPDTVPGIAVGALAELGLPGLTVAGGAPGPDGSAGQPWSAAAGWANLEHGETMRTDHAFPAYEITKLITAVTVLRLVADGGLGLDDTANHYLRTIRLADDSVTVRELLLHTGGVTSPDQAASFAATVPDLATLTGPVLACTGRRGVFEYSYGGYAALGQLIAGRTGQPYPEAVSRLVLRPLGMTGSWFTASWPDSGAVTPYEAATGGAFQPMRAAVGAIAAAAGLWTTAGDLARFGLAWPSLLPRALVSEALRPQAERPNGTHSGLGWIVNEPAGLAGHAGDGPGAGASLLMGLQDGAVCAALANRALLLEPVTAGVLRATHADVH